MSKYRHAIDARPHLSILYEIPYILTEVIVRQFLQTMPVSVYIYAFLRDPTITLNRCSIGTLTVYIRMCVNYTRLPGCGSGWKEGGIPLE